MPSYRYTREISEGDLQPDQPKEYTRREQRANWWRYHWKLVAVLTAAVAFVLWFILTLALRTKPDMSIGVLTTQNMPDQLVERLQEGLEQLVGDINGDGKAYVELTVYNVQPPVEEGQEQPQQSDGDTLADVTGAYSMYDQMAGVVKLTTALTNGDSMLFIVQTDMLEAYQEGYDLLGPLDDEGTLAVAWADLAPFTAMDLMLETNDGEAFDGQIILEYFSVGVRALYGTSLEGDAAATQNHEAALALIGR